MRARSGSDQHKKRTSTTKNVTTPTARQSFLDGPTIRAFVLAVLLALTCFLSGEQNERSGVAHRPAMLWILCALGCMLQAWRHRHSVRSLKFGKIDVFVYAFFGWMGLTTLWNLLPGLGGAPRPSLNLLSVWLLCAAAWFSLRQLLDGDRMILGALIVLFAIMSSESLLGIYQRYVDIPRMQRQFELDPERTLAMVDPSVSPDSPNWARLASRLRTACPTGTYPMSNTLGGLLGCWFVFFLGLKMVGRRQDARQPNSKAPGPNDDVTKNFLRFYLKDVVFFCGVAALFAGTLLTQCRSAYIAVLFGFALLVAEKFKRHWAIHFSRGVILAVGIAIVCILVVVATTPSLPGKKILSGAKQSLGYRFEYWVSSSEMIRDYPVFGCGSGNFKQTYTKYKLPAASEEINDPHNFAIEIAATGGLPAVLFFCLAILSIGHLFLRQNTFSPRNDCLTQTGTKSGPVAFNIRPGLCGTVVGVWTAFLLSFSTEAPMDPLAPLTASVVCLPLFFAFEQRSNDRQNTSNRERCSHEIIPSLPLIGAIVLLVHLSAAGGISVFSTAISLWFFVAIALALMERNDMVNRSAFERASRLKYKRSGRFLITTKRFSHAICLAIIVFWIACLVGIQFFGASPVNHAFFALNFVEMERTPIQRSMQLESVVQKDPWSATIRERLATEYFAAWFTCLQNPDLASQNGLNDPAYWQNKTLRTQEQTLRLIPRSASIRFAFAERMNLIFQQTQSPEIRDEALRFYREAIERYPNYARFRAPYVLLLWNIGQKYDALIERDRAIALDDAMPHADQKLSEEQRLTLIGLKGG